MASTLNQEIWIGEVSKVLVQNSGFWTGAKNDSSFVDSYGKVNIPQMLTKPTINTYEKGVTSLPLTPAALSADILEYSTRLTYSDPVYADVVDEAQFSFDIASEGAKNIGNAFLENIQLQFLHSWTIESTGSKASTTGSTRTNIYGNTAAKAITDADFLKAILYLNKQGVPQSGRRAILSVTMFNDLLALIGVANFNFMLTEDAVKRGVVAMYRGFEIYTSNYTAAFATGGTKKAIGAAVVNTDKESALFFHPEFVRYANTAPIMKVGDGTLLLADSVFVMKQWNGASPSYKEVSNVTTGIYTVIEG